MNHYKVLKTEEEYRIALNRTIQILHADPGTSEFEELELLLVLVKDYEDKHIIIPELDPIEVIKLKMEERGLKAKDLEAIIGSKGPTTISTEAYACSCITGLVVQACQQSVK
jgi:HTH-type transcriptional regulator/antitoxin HigA